MSGGRGAIAGLCALGTRAIRRRGRALAPRGRAGLWFARRRELGTSRTRPSGLAPCDAIFPPEGVSGTGPDLTGARFSAAPAGGDVPTGIGSRRGKPSSSPARRPCRVRQAPLVRFSPLRRSPAATGSPGGNRPPGHPASALACRRHPQLARSPARPPLRCSGQPRRPRPLRAGPVGVPASVARCPARPPTGHSPAVLLAGVPGPSGGSRGLAGPASRVGRPGDAPGVLRGRPSQRCSGPRVWVAFSSSPSAAGIAIPAVRRWRPAVGAFCFGTDPGGRPAPRARAFRRHAPTCRFSDCAGRVPCDRCSHPVSAWSGRGDMRPARALVFALRRRGRAARRTVAPSAAAPGV